MTANLELAAAPQQEPLSTRRLLELLRDLQRLANQRRAEEQRVRTALQEGLAAAAESHDRMAEQIEREYAEARARATDEYETATADARRRYESDRDDAQREYKGLRQVVESEHSHTTEAARSEQQQLTWEAQAVYEAVQGRPRQRLLETVKRLERTSHELAMLEHDSTTVMKLRRQWRELPPVELPDVDAGEPTPGAPASADGEDRDPTAASGANAARGRATMHDPVDQAIASVNGLARAVREEAEALVAQRLPRLFEGFHPFAAFILLWLATIVPSGLALGWQAWPQWLTVSLVFAVVVYAGVFVWLWPRARRQSGEQFDAVRRRLAEAHRAIDEAVARARERARLEAQALLAERDQQLAAADQKLHAVLSEKDRWKEGEIGRAGQTFPQRLAEIRQALDASLVGINERYKAALAQATETRDRRDAENRRQYEARCRELRQEHDGDWVALRDRWFDGLAALRQAWAGIDAQCDRYFPDWETVDYDTWQPPAEPPAAIRFGAVTLDLAGIKHGVPQDERLRPAETRFELPALMTLDEHPVMVLTAEDEGRRQAVDVLQLAMLRLLTAMPAGKVRFTILDPVGLGESFASFMHLADYDEQLIASRIWTEGKQIDEQLTRLTAHMETVLQKYLRNEFATIHEYNERAGEVAEPFQVLVVANFPVNFSESAARKLVSIATSGPRCGVYTLVSVDRKQRLPSDFDANDLVAGAVHLDWQPKRCQEPFPPEKVPDTFSFRWRYPALEHLPLALDRPPSAERFNEVVRAAGRAAKDSMKVEVPFEVVAPAADEYWSGDCRQELVVPIGRAGAMRLQPVRLGRGTSQHLLVCGKTGSGKSTFLHALITNTALHYSPDEVEFYLIDFKKGVEFKTYATHRLPHARVIAIESEREFGLSVLERLDAELRRRGDLFRAAGVQDLADYRARVAAGGSPASAKTGESPVTTGQQPMPRVLLVIDEFQELFVEDDKLAQDAALLLDRLVRQGRAFGIHVLLGSQTLSGAYSLARSTMGQMAVRVALQCSEADAHLILSDERNMAARFLNRPGEAIYNDQNGLVAGNHPFQVVWLPETKRIEYLRRIEARSKEQWAQSRETIVFEGDQPANPADNGQLRQLLEHSSDSPLPALGSLPQKAWLGAAVAIKEPTAATFARHAGSNLLVVGPWENSALGVMTNALIALAAQTGTVPRFFILDGTRPESPHVGTWQRVADALPHQVEVAGVRDTARVIGDVAAELARRESAGEEDAPPVYLIISGGGRFRDLRRSEDDFSFSIDADKPPTPDRQWAEILRNGPAWGVHTLLWCDSYNNVTRLLDRMMLREFEMRVAFQMGAADSSSLLDTPLAAKLRAHRGLFASEDVGTLEKFRPYGIPTDAWLDEVKQALTKPRSEPSASPDRGGIV